ncbi:MAG: LytTR family DNA-binding domain-containing protein [Gemmatimonadaceae bacterium]
MSDVRVLVVDDEALARERLVTLVRATPRLEFVGEGVNGLEALDLITSIAPDLVLLDIEMPELGGFDVISALDPAAIPGVVFVTAYEDYALQAFDVDAIDYLQKPVSPERFGAAMQRALRRLTNDDDVHARAGRMLSAIEQERKGHRTRFVVRRGSSHTFVAARDVLWIHAEDNYLQLHTTGQAHLVRGTIGEAERELNPAKFMRIHRSCIVNLEHIVAIEAQTSGGYVVRLDDGSKLRTSRQYASGVRALIAPLKR